MSGGRWMMTAAQSRKNSKRKVKRTEDPQTDVIELDESMLRAVGIGTFARTPIGMLGKML